MKRFISIVAMALPCLWIGPGVSGATKQPVIDVRGPAIVAFFVPVTKAELEKNDGANEALSDFQFYASQVREPLRQAGIEFHEVYAPSFQIRIGKRLTVFHPEKAEVGYYFAAPGKKPRVEYGVMTDSDLLALANDYFGITSK